MRHSLIVSSAILLCAATIPAQAAGSGEPAMQGDHGRAMAAMGGDSRQSLILPPEMRRHTLANMRDHLAALSEILAAMSSAHYVKAARIASTRLGLESPAAAACQGEPGAGAAMMSGPGDMDLQMAKHMPEGMRKIGLEMHTAASDFSAKVLRASGVNNTGPALASLSRVIQQCSACHAAYKVQ